MAAQGGEGPQPRSLTHGTPRGGHILSGRRLLYVARTKLLGSVAWPSKRCPRDLLEDCF